MGLFGRVKKAVKRVVRKVEDVAHKATGQDPIGTRSEAADQMLNSPQKKNVDISKQAGSGQIKYTGETIE